LLSTKLSHPEFAQVLIKGNLQTESVPVDSTASGERKNYVIIANQIITHITNSNLSMDKHVHSKGTYPLRVYQITV